MATFSTGITAKFTTLSGTAYWINEPTSISWSGPSGSSRNRASTIWTDNAGDVSVSFRGSGPGTGQYGLVGYINVTGGDMDINWRCVCDRVSYSTTLNGFTSKTVTFRVLT